MRCRYCKTENFGSAEICIACGEPISPDHHEPKAVASEKLGKTPVDNVVPINGGTNVSGSNPDLTGTPAETSRCSTFKSASANSSNGPEAPATPEKTNASNSAGAFAKTYSAGTTPSSDYGGFGQAGEQGMSKSAGAASFERASAGHASPFTNSRLDDLEKQSTLFSGENSIFPTRFAKLTVMISGFVIVIASVFIGAWWMDISIVGRTVAAITNWGQPSKVAIAEPSKQTAVGKSRGISTAELPYDGTQDGTQPALSSGDSAHASFAMEPEELPYGGKVPGIPAKDEKLALNDESSSPPPVSKTRPATNAKSHTSTAATRSSESRPARRTHSEARYNTDKAAWYSQASTRSRVMQCNNIDGFFSREKCKWQVCSGQWGKNGCPSYVKPDRQY